MSHHDDPEWRSAYAQLDAAVQELHRLIERDNDEPGDPSAFPTDYVLVVGSMFVDEQGDRCGITSMYPKDGSQPAYITTGLLTEARDAMGRR